MLEEQLAYPLIHTVLGREALEGDREGCYGRGDAKIYQKCFEHSVIKGRRVFSEQEEEDERKEKHQNQFS